MKGLFACIPVYLSTCVHLLSFQFSFRKQLLKWRDEFLDAVRVEPLAIRITGITEALGQRPTFILESAFPQGFRRFDNKHVFTFYCIARLILGDKHLMDFFPGADEIGRASCRERVSLLVVAVPLK